ncbi:carboxylesterase family protein [uncultured Cedecea sp.]|uniref:carboxylesterase family protein n=1 Tax=uncultured Cedecea sp. TaxID=988762 RepID=UPI0026243604|nr:carboxylesterase family protein [uncultured Cedecea sp.]
MVSVLCRAISFTLLSASCVSALAQDNPLIIETSYGKILGTEQQGVEYWTGIPYAQAPVAQLRWQPPETPKKWTDIRDTTQPAADCIQVTADGTKGQEDCLNLNVYRPQTSDRQLPVLFYIHGGNNQVGTSTEFNPQHLATTLNAVIVTANYRLGALGFNPLSALNTGDARQDSGNFTLLDIKSALDWVKQNASAFGGDANNITVSGFSAGGRDVMAMLISPLFASSFQKAIVFSGGMTTSDKNEAEKIFARRFAEQVVKDGIKPTVQQAEAWLLAGGDEVKQYLYHLPAAQLASFFGDAGIRMAKFPHLYRDGTVLPESGFDTLKYNAVPVLMFSGQSEFSFFALGDPYFQAAFKQGTLAQDTELLNKYAFANKYGSLLYSLFNVNQSAEKMYPHYPAPIYGAEFRFGMDAFVTGSRMAPIGSFHGVFMPFWDPVKYEVFTADAIKLAGAKKLGEQFNGYIRQFIRTGNPDVPGQPAWKAWTPENVAAGESILELDASKQKALISMRSKSYNVDDVIRAIEQDHSITPDAKKEMLSSVLKGRWFSEKLDAHFAH